MTSKYHSYLSWLYRTKEKTQTDAPRRTDRATAESVSAAHMSHTTEDERPTSRGGTVNVILFGEQGVGKSSVINLIARKYVAYVTTDLGDHGKLPLARHKLEFDGIQFTIFETRALDSPLTGVHDYFGALERSYELIDKLFVELMCQSRVPLALVFTGLEHEVEMEDWWTRSKTRIEGYYGIKSDGHACITAVQDDTLKHKESQNSIRELLKKCYLKDHPYLPDVYSCFARVGSGIRSMCSQEKLSPSREGVAKALMKRCGLDSRTAKQIANMIERGDYERKEGQHRFGGGEGQPRAAHLQNEEGNGGGIDPKTGTETDSAPTSLNGAPNEKVGPVESGQLKRNGVRDPRGRVDESAIVGRDPRKREREVPETEPVVTLARTDGDRATDSLTDGTSIRFIVQARDDRIPGTISTPTAFRRVKSPRIPKTVTGTDLEPTSEVPEATIDHAELGQLGRNGVQDPRRRIDEPAIVERDEYPRKKEREVLEAEPLARTYGDCVTESLTDAIRSNFPHDLTGHVTRSEEFAFATGGCGDIYRGIFDVKGRSLQVAIKTCKMYLQCDGPGDLDKKIRRFRREVKVWMKLDHPNVLRLFGTIRDPKLHPEIPAMVSPWVENGALTTYLERNDELLVSTRVNDVARGLQYLHSQKIVHGDLTGSNVVVHADGSACISDFGLSTLLTHIGGSTFATTRSNKGTPRWMAPELLDLDGPEIMPTVQGDVYSFGSIMLQILTGRIPYHYLTRDVQVIHAITTGKKHKRPDQTVVTENRWKFIEWCWFPANAAESRPTGDQIVDFARKELADLRVGLD